MNVIVVGGDTNTVIVQQEPPKQVVVQAPGPSMLVGALRWDIAQTLTSPQQAQARSNMGFAAAVIATALTGFTAAAGGTITSADTVLSAFGKVEYRLADLEDGALTGPLTITANSSSAALTLVNNGAGLALTTTGGITAGAFTGPLTGNVTGNITGSSGSTTGNAATATALQTARAINGVNFDGTGAITITAAAGTLTGTTLNATVTASSLTSLGTLSSLAVGGAQTITLNSASAGLTITQSGAGAALSTNGQIVSTLATGTAPFSVASTTNVANLNASSLNGATFAAPGTIGGGTPGAATFTTLTATGQVSLGGAAGAEGLRVSTTASAVNFVNAYGAVTAGFPGIFFNGADANVSGGILTKGTGSIGLYTNSGSQLQFLVNHTASAVDYLFATGSSAAFPGLYAAGASTNVSAVVSGKGNGGVFVCTNGATVQFLISHMASAVNYLQATGSVTGSPVTLIVTGTDTNAGTYFATKGTGFVRFATGGGDQLRIAHTASAANYANVTGSATGLSVVYGAGGSDTNVPTVITSKGGSPVGICTNTGTVTAAFFQHVTSAVNCLTVYGSATGQRSLILMGGSDTNSGVNISSKGTGDILFTGGSASYALFQINGSAAGAVNYLRVSPATTGNAVSISVEGSDTNRSITLTTAGTGTVRFKNKIYPGTPAAATQTDAGISGGTGAPSNADASDGDFYFRSDGGALTSIYQKRAGAWVGIV